MYLPFRDRFEIGRFQSHPTRPIPPAPVDVSAAAEPIWPDDYSLYCFSPRNPIRACCICLIHSTGFEWVVFAFVMGSSAALVFDSPRLDPESSTARLLDQLEWVWVTAFCTELLLKVRAGWV